MSASWQAHSQFRLTAQKWRALAERRRAEIVALRDTGGWQNRYTEAQFMALMREAVETAETWARIAPPPAEESGAPAEPDAQASDRSHRTAA